MLICKKNVKVFNFCKYFKFFFFLLHSSVAAVYISVAFIPFCGIDALF